MNSTVGYEIYIYIYIWHFGLYKWWVGALGKLCKKVMKYGNMHFKLYMWYMVLGNEFVTSISG